MHAGLPQLLVSMFSRHLVAAHRIALHHAGCLFVHPYPKLDYPMWEWKCELW